MKLKTFFISYILFLTILLGALGTISFYLTSHHMQSLREQSLSEYERIASVIERELDAIYGRGVEQFVIDALLESHINFHLNRQVLLSIEPVDDILSPVNITFSTENKGYLMFVEGGLNTSAGQFAFTVTFNVTATVDDLRQIQQIFLYLFIAFALFLALILYIVLNKIFKPLELVAISARKIADGNYQERIEFSGKHEIAIMGNHFNQMAEVIENKIHLLQEEAQRKQNFMDNLAHEIRTPLTSIYGYAEYMQKAVLDESEKIESATYIMSEAIHMKKIANSMLELATLQHHTLEKEVISIPILFDQIATTLEIPFQDYKVELVTYSLHEVLIGQEDLIKSLILNLCMNGAKACEPRVGKVILKAEKEADGLVISIVDNGCGMASDEIEKITEPFYQVDQVRNRASGGIGLGLTLVKEIIKLHDAQLIIESELGIGTTVKIHFTTS